MCAHQDASVVRYALCSGLVMGYGTQHLLGIEGTKKCLVLRGS